MRVENIDGDPDSLHQAIISDHDLGFTQAIIAQRRGCAQSTVSEVLAAERRRRLRDALAMDGDAPETSVKAVHAAEQVREALAYVRAVERRLKAVQRLLVADAADKAAEAGRVDGDPDAAGDTDAPDEN